MNIRDMMAYFFCTTLKRAKRHTVFIMYYVSFRVGGGMDSENHSVGSGKIESQFV